MSAAREVVRSPLFKPAVFEAIKDPSVFGYLTPRSVPLAAVRDAAWGELAYSQAVVDQTGITAIAALTNLSVTVTIGYKRAIRISGQGLVSRTIADGVTVGSFVEGATELGRWAQHSPSAATEFSLGHGAVRLPRPGQPAIVEGVHTYYLSLWRVTGTGTVALSASATNPAWIMVEDLGPTGEV